MVKNSIWLLCYILTGLACLSSCTDKKGSDLPNIIFILADDLGYGDLGCYNAESLIPTPNLDKLAIEGVRLTNAYCPVSVCSPSRYALMTGKYPWRSWKKSGVMRNYERSMINPQTLTFPEMLQQSGYRTAGFGKWHLGTTFQTLDGKDPAGFEKFRADDNGANLDLSKPVLDGPIDHGFDHWIGFSCASETWIFKDDRIFGAVGHELYTIEAAPNKDHIEVIPLPDYLPFLADKTMNYLQRQSGSNKPFFIYFAPYVPHIPLAVSEAFRGSTHAGLYGDYVHELDYYIGNILSKLKEIGMDENTIVMFASDNGSQFRITSQELDSLEASNSPADIFDNEGAQGHRPNGDLRGTKWSIYEGGVRMPFLIKWPREIQPATHAKGIFGMNDVMATLAETVGFDLDGQVNDSKSQWAMLTGQKKAIRSEIVLQSSGRDFALRKGEWKYIWKSKNDSSELYNLDDDPSEQFNQLETQKSIAKEMHVSLLEHIKMDIQ